MSDSRDNRNLRCGNTARQTFVIECRKIFGRSAATGDDDHINILRAIEILDPGSDLICCALALYLRGENENVRRMMAAAQNVQNISQSGGLRRSHNANTARQWRNWLLSRGIE